MNGKQSAADTLALSTLVMNREHPSHVLFCLNTIF